VTDREKRLAELLRRERGEIDKLKADRGNDVHRALRLRVSAAGRMVLDTGRIGFPISLTQAEAELIFVHNLERCARWFQLNRSKMAC
jgi:hypothetical protein